jgi:hypothetical protein
VLGKFDHRGITCISKRFARQAGAIAAAIGVMGLSSIALPRSALAAEASGTVQLRLVQASFVGSASTGSGVLHFQGHDYKFTTTGGGIGGFGLSKFEASGTVYDLKSVADFDGPYAQLRTGIALGEQGKGKMWLRNANGVTMSLNGRRRGLALSLGADALVVSFTK